MLIGTAVLLLSGCSTTRSSAVRESADLRTVEQRSMEAKDSVVVELRDTVVETTTIMIDRNEVGDTVRITQITDRLRTRNRDKIARQTTKTEVVVDTVYVERRDSVATNGKYGGGQSGRTALHTTLRLILWIIIATGVLVIIIRLAWRKW